MQRQRTVEGLRDERPAPSPLVEVLDPNPACPHCRHTPCGRWGRAGGLPRFRGAACGKTCNPLTRTLLARLRHRACWPAYAQALIEGDTVRAAARRGGVPKNPSFRWRHRFLTLPAEVKPVHLHGIVAADETYFLASHQGARAAAPTA